MPKVFIRDPNAQYELPDESAILAVVGPRIRALRKNHGMTQIELSRNIGKESSAYIAMIEDGKRNMRATDLIRLAVHLKVSMSYFYP